MNVHDTDHNTKFVTLHPDVVEITQTNKGSHVTMGVPFGVLNLMKYQTGKQRVVLLIIDGDEYDKRSKE